MVYRLVMNWICVMNGFMMVCGVVDWLMDWVVMVYWSFVMVWGMHSIIMVNEIVDNSPVEFFKLMHSLMMSQCFVVIIVMEECMMLMDLIMVESMVNARLNRSEEFNQSSGSVISSFEILVNRPIMLFFFNISLDCFSMCKPSLSYTFSEMDWVLKNISPLLNSIYIIIHMITRLDCIW